MKVLLRKKWLEASLVAGGLGMKLKEFLFFLVNFLSIEFQQRCLVAGPSSFWLSSSPDYTWEAVVVFSTTSSALYFTSLAIFSNRLLITVFLNLGCLKGVNYCSPSWGNVLPRQQQLPHSTARGDWGPILQSVSSPDRPPLNFWWGPWQCRRSYPRLHPPRSNLPPKFVQ